MRRNILLMTLAMMLSVAFCTLAHKMERRASASNTNSLFAGAVSINDVTLTEGNAGTSNMQFTVTVTGSHTNTVGVSYSTANGGATAPSDYTSTSGQMVFLGTTDETATRTISVPIIGDTVVEPDETFVVNLQIVDFSATLADGQGVGTITNDDTAGCTYTISPTSQNFTHSGGVGSVTVTAAPGCLWTASSNMPLWLSITSGANGSGNGTVDYSVQANTDAMRTGTMTIAGQPFTVNQETGIGSPCDLSAYSVSPTAKVFDSEGGTGGIDVTAPSLCTWSATSSTPWILVTSPGEAQGNGRASYLVQDNQSLNGRSGTISINGVIHQVHQTASGCLAHLICNWFPSSCDPQGPNVVQTSRKFRDEVLAHTPRGHRYTRLYYELSTEAVAIVMLNPMLVLRSREVMERYMPVVQAMVKGEQVTLTGGDIEEIDGFLRSFAEKGGVEFRETLRNLREDLRDPQVQREFKITVTTGTKRELSGWGGLQPVTKTSLMIGPLGLFLFGFYRRKSLQRAKRLARRSLFCSSPRSGLLNSFLRNVERTLDHRTRIPNLRRFVWVVIPFSLLVAQGPIVSGELLRASGAKLCTALPLSSAVRLCLTDQHKMVSAATPPYESAPLDSWLALGAEIGGAAAKGNISTPVRQSLIALVRRHSRIGSDNTQSNPLSAEAAPAYSSYFGGNKNEEGNSIAVDAAGNIYVTGFTDSTNFPLVNASQPTFGGGQQDAFVAKLDPSGTQLLYSTYIGGNGQDNATSLAVDAAGNAYLTGFTDSTNFPVSSAFQPTNRGNFNAFVVKLDPAGAVLNSTLFGGTVSDYGSSIAVDSVGNVYVAGLATSPDIPTTNALQSSLGGLVDVFVAKINPSGSGLIYSTYLGGGGIDGASSIAVDSAENLYLTGLTSSLNFTTLNPLQATHGGGTFDAFVVKLNPSGTQIVYSTFLGGSGEDRSFRIALDSTASAYVTGDTDSTDFPVMNALQPIKGGSADAFVAKLNPAGTQLVYSTYLGGSGIEGGTAIAVDSAGGASLAGFTASTNFPTMNPLQANLAGAYDGFVAKLNPSGSALASSTYLGGSSTDSVFGITADSIANVYVMGVTDSTNFPTANAFQGANGGGTADVFIAKLAGQSPTAAPASISGQVTTSDGVPLAGVTVLLGGPRSAIGITNSAGRYSFLDLETGGFYTLTPERANYIFSPARQSFSLVSNKPDVAFTALATAPTANPLDTSPEFFVRQHYLDFLNREPDQNGLAYWSAQIRQCNGDAQCTRHKRIDVSNAFFYELEFQQTGAFVYRMYKAAFGTLPGAPQRANLTYAQFMPDRSHVVGGPQLDAAKTDFANEFVLRSAFTGQYPGSLTAGQYVDALNANTGNLLTSAQRNALVSGLQNGTETRGSVLRKLADGGLFVEREYNPSFVLTQYFGYLRRDPDQSGFDFWLGQVNRFPVRDVSGQHAMVCSFITSSEYQERFGSVINHSNQECLQ